MSAPPKLGRGPCGERAASAARSLRGPSILILLFVLAGVVPADAGTQYTAPSGAATSADRTLSNLTSTTTARTNLGLGTAATADTGTSSGQVPVLGSSGLPAVGASLLTGLTSSQIAGLGTAATAAATSFALVANNLSDLASPSTARTNLGLGTAAVLDTGTSSGQVPVLGSSGLPAVGASLLTGLTSSQIAGLGTAATAAATSFALVANNLSDLASPSTARTNLGLGSAATLTAGASANNLVQLDGSARLPAVDGSQLTGVQPLDATLTALAGVASSTNQLPYFIATDTAGVTTLTQAGRDLIDDADASAQRTTLGLGTAAVLNTGTSAGNAVVLDGSARLPAVDGSQLTNLPSGGVSTSCSWTVEWLASGGTALASSGWTLTGLTSSGITTDTAGASYERLSTSGTSIGYLVHGTYAPGPTEAWEIEVDWAPSALDGATALGADEGTSNIRDRFLFDASDLRFENASSLAWGSTMRTAASLRQVWTMRRARSSHTTVYVDGMPVGRLARASGSSGGHSAGGNSYCVGGCQTGGSSARTYDIYAIRIRDAGVCAGMPWARHTTEVYGP